MIKIKQNDGKWRILVDNEEWEFKDLEEMQKELNNILGIKSKHGIISKENPLAAMFKPRGN